MNHYVQTDTLQCTNVHAHTHAFLCILSICLKMHNEFVEYPFLSGALEVCSRIYIFLFVVPFSQQADWIIWHITCKWNTKWKPLSVAQQWMIAPHYLKLCLSTSYGMILLVCLLLLALTLLEQWLYIQLYVIKWQKMTLIWINCIPQALWWSFGLQCWIHCRSS